MIITGSPYFFISTGIVVLFDFVCLPLYLNWLKLHDYEKVKWLLIAKPFSTIFCIYFMFSQFGGGFFLGAFYSLLALIITLIMFLVLIIQGIRFRIELGYSNLSYVRNLFGGLVIVIMLAIPSILRTPIKNECANANSTKILTISKALEVYVLKNGGYPKSLDNLVPEFLPYVPSLTCKVLSGFPNPFELNTCNPENPYIHTRTLDGMGFEYYSLEDGSYWRQASFLDGGPEYCP